MAKPVKVKAYRRLVQHPYRLPPNSRLYHLSPIGAGTPEIECLTGYIGRLAQEHLITPYQLLLKEVAPLLKGYQAIAHKAQFSLFHRPINGTGRTATAFVEVIQELTKQDDLYYLTLLPWSAVLTSHSLIRAYRAWCPYCYEEQRLSNESCYDLLLWVLDLIDVCPKHEKPLTKNCPHCGSHHLHIGARSRPGYCSKCLGFLGEKVRRKDANILGGLNHEMEWQLWKSKAVGELLATSSQCLSLTRSNVAKSLDYCVRTYSWGSISTFNTQFPMGHQKFRSWLKGDTLPILESILGMCFKLGISPLSFMKGSLDEERTSTDIRPALMLEDNRSKSSTLSPPKLTHDEVDIELHKALTTFPPPSIKDFMEKSGWGRGRLKKWFPELYFKIKARHYSLIEPVSAEKTLQLALTENPPPSLNLLARRIGCKNPGTLYDHFPNLTKAIVNRYKKHRYKQVNWKHVRAGLCKALRENPPPSLREVTRRLKLSEPPYSRFSDLCKALSNRYISYVKSHAEERRFFLRQGIHKAVASLTSKGLRPSRERIKRLLGININPAEFTEAMKELK
ncbi:MAG TPA: TniQ family protein [Pyrinomonadaceae bacterium]|nr:TniQ family protein [Pyrinomonadaceae bacterium]